MSGGQRLPRVRGRAGVRRGDRVQPGRAVRQGGGLQDHPPPRPRRGRPRHHPIHTGASQLR